MTHLLKLLHPTACEACLQSINSVSLALVTSRSLRRFSCGNGFLPRTGFDGCTSSQDSGEAVVDEQSPETTVRMALIVCTINGYVNCGELAEAGCTLCDAQPPILGGRSPCQSVSALPILRTGINTCDFRLMLMHRIRRTICLAGVTVGAAFALSSTGAVAQAAGASSAPSAVAAVPAGDAPASVRQAVAASMARLDSGARVASVSKSPLPVLFEVVTDGGEIFYVDEGGQYLISGNLIDISARRNVTAERLEKINAIDFASLPLQDALVHKRGNGQRKLAVLADPNCGFCKRLEGELAKLDNVTVYTFLLPVLGEDSVRKSNAIWCAGDRNAAWTDWMLKSTPAPAAKEGCSAPLARIAAIARSKRVTGTPLIVFSDSTRAPGALPMAQLERRLAVAAEK